MKQTETTYLSNFSYVFVPFSLEDHNFVEQFKIALAKNPFWLPSQDEVRYLHRYVSDRLVGDTPNVFHYIINPDQAQSAGLFLDGRVYSTDVKKYKGAELTFDFTILNAHLYLFNTGIGLLVLQLHFQDDDPLKIAAAQYYLRKIQAEPFHTEGSKPTNFVALADRLLNSNAHCKLDFFFYAHPKNQRANFLTYIDVPAKKDYQEELFHLKWCYHDGFSFDSNNSDDHTACIIDTEKIWGISSSAAVCLVKHCNHNRKFIEDVFQKNFQQQYLFTYILLLHQKYMAYLFLTKLSLGITRAQSIKSLPLLEDYKRRLYEFETQYKFSRISEVPQYQTFYEKVFNAFSIAEMFQDVQGPLTQLSDIYNRISEEQRKKYDQNINTALTTLSLLAVVSAITDASGITANLDWLFAPLISKIIQSVSIICVLCISILTIIRLISLRKKD